MATPPSDSPFAARGTSDSRRPTRRALLKGGGALALAGPLAGCSDFTGNAQHEVDRESTPFGFAGNTASAAGFDDSPRSETVEIQEEGRAGPVDILANVTGHIRRYEDTQIGDSLDDVSAHAAFMSLPLVEGTLWSIEALATLTFPELIAERRDLVNTFGDFQATREPEIKIKDIGDAARSRWFGEADIYTVDFVGQEGPLERNESVTFFGREITLDEITILFVPSTIDRDLYAHYALATKVRNEENDDGVFCMYVGERLVVENFVREEFGPRESGFTFAKEEVVPDEVPGSNRWEWGLFNFEQVGTIDDRFIDVLEADHGSLS